MNTIENLADKYKHIKGWGMDAVPDDEPNYPMKNYTGDDHNRLNYERPPQQPENVEVLHSNERPSISAAFGASVPPSGLSGVLRRKAFKYSEGKIEHWLMLLAADRVNVVEGFVDDLVHGHLPNIFAEKGWKAKWEHNPKGLVKKVAILLLISTAAVALLSTNKNSKKKS